MNTYFTTHDKAKCCGCAGCMSVCPKSAISMEEDEKGFFYPKINKEKCIDCKACERFCEFSRTVLKPAEKINSYVCVLKDEKKLNESSSGGVFTAVSDLVLDKGGVIFGAVMGDDFNVVIQSAASSDERDAMRRTKYVQSRMDGVFKAIKAYLNDGKTVLFTGTPCQCASIRKYVGANQNLILMDFICHGVPSPKVFRTYISYIEKLTKKKIVKFYFRSKEFGHRHSQHSEAYSEKGGVYYMMPSADVYYKSFLDNMISRDSCYECPYTSTSRGSDLTMGDAWGTVAKEMDNSKGISTLIVNTEKGEKLLDMIKDTMTIKPVDISQRLQPQLKHPAKKPEMCDKWWEAFERKGLKGIKKNIFTSKQRVLNIIMEHKIKRYNSGNKPEKIKVFLRKVWK